MKPIISCMVLATWCRHFWMHWERTFAHKTEILERVLSWRRSREPVGAPLSLLGGRREGAPARRSVIPLRTTARLRSPCLASCRLVGHFVESADERGIGLLMLWLRSRCVGKAGQQQLSQSLHMLERDGHQPMTPQVGETDIIIRD